MLEGRCVMTTNHVVDQLKDTVPRPVTDHAVVVAVSGTSVFFPAMRSNVATLTLECDRIVNTNEIVICERHYNAFSYPNCPVYIFSEDIRYNYPALPGLWESYCFF